MENKSQHLISFLKAQKSSGGLDNATVELHQNNNHLYLGIDSSEVIYQIKYKTDDDSLAMALELVGLAIKEKKVDDVFKFSQKQIQEIAIGEMECLEFIDKSGVKLDMGLALLRNTLLDYWGFLVANEEIQDLICRCKGLGRKQIVDKYYALQSDAKKVFLETNIAGVCGSCKADVNKILNELELSEDELFGKNKEYWQQKIDELINEYYLVCPPEFSSLQFSFISITPRNIKLKCTREGDGPARPKIQDSLNNFFKGQLDRDIPISVVI